MPRLSALSICAALSCAPAPAPDGRGAGGDGDTGVWAEGVVPLLWVGSEGGLDWDQAQQALDWNLSWLGALPPADQGHLEVWELGSDRVRFGLHLDQVGWPADRVPVAQAALEELMASDEVAQEGAADVGRFLMTTLHEPWVYYALTQPCPTAQDWQAAFLSGPVQSYSVTVSLLSPGDRFVQFADGPWTDPSDLHLLAQTGTGSLEDGDFVATEHETVDVMANGQQRFATYDHTGALRPSADPEVVNAGQPGRCMWCHEGSLQVGTPANPGQPGGLDYAGWAAATTEMQGVIDAHRAGLDTSVPFADHPSVHTWGERMVRDFLLPTPDRVAGEWGIPLAQLEARADAEGWLRADDPEWPERGPVYRRADVDQSLADAGERTPYRVLDDARDLDPDAEGLRGAWLAADLPPCG